MNKSRLLAMLGGIIAAVTASLCCIGPLAAAAAGAGAFAASAIFEKWRPVYLAATFAFLALAWYLTYRKPKVDFEESSACAARHGSKWIKMVLWCATAFALTAAAFPRLSSTIFHGKQGTACCMPGLAIDENTDSATRGVKSTLKDNSPDQTSFFEVPLVCPTAPQIGCGSHAKPILLALESQSAIAEAWLNRAGTRMAVVWKARAKPADRAAALNKITATGFEAREMSGSEGKEALKSFLSGHGWYRGNDVDRLSEEEAGIIAARLVRRIQARVQVSGQAAAAIQRELAAVFKRRLTVSHTNDNPSAQAQVLKVLQAHLDEKDVAMVKQSLPRNARPSPGEE